MSVTRLQCYVWLLMAVCLIGWVSSQHSPSLTDRLVSDIVADVRDQHHDGNNDIAFRHYDTDGDTMLSKDEVLGLLQEHKEVQGFFSLNIKANRVFSLMGKNMDGYIDIVEFSNELRPKPRIRHDEL